MFSRDVIFFNVTLDESKAQFCYVENVKIRKTNKSDVKIGQLFFSIPIIIILNEME